MTEQQYDILCIRASGILISAKSLVIGIRFLAEHESVFFQASPRPSLSSDIDKVCIRSLLQGCGFDPSSPYPYGVLFGAFLCSYVRTCYELTMR